MSEGRVIRPDLFFFDEGPDGFRLYLAELSTAEGLALFDPTTPIAIVSFGATSYRNLGWATEKDIPPLDTVGAARAFLDAQPALGLIDFEALVEDDASLSSHDDGECHFWFRERSALTAALCAVMPPDDGGRLVHAVLSHPGRYVTLDGTGAIVFYTSFDAYLAARKTPP
jgi:hypothetical protein